MTTQVGFLGLGVMGSAMARNLQSYIAKHQDEFAPLIVWNRTASKAKPVQDLGANVANSIAEVVQKCSIIFMILQNDTVDRAVVSEMVKEDVKGKIIIDCATVHPDCAFELFTQASGKGAHWIQSPVFGAGPVAEAGKLIFVPAGDKSIIEKVVPLMYAMGRKHMYVGSDVRLAASMKLTGNVFILGLMELAAEVQVMGESLGISAENVTEWATEFAGPMIGMYFGKNSKGIYDPGLNGSPFFTVENALKDSGHARDLALAHGAQLPIMDITRENLRRADELKGSRSNLDASAVYGALRVNAGMDFENDAVKKREAGEK